MTSIYKGEHGFYKLEEPDIGKGGFCQIHKVSGKCETDKRNPNGQLPRRFYAVKELRPEFLGNEHVEESLGSELKLLYGLYTADNHHSNIIGVLDYNLKAPKPFGVMELANRSLKDQIQYEQKSWLRKLFSMTEFPKYSIPEKLRMFKTLASVLNLLHTMPAPIVHRDFKPGNLLFIPVRKGPELLKLSDFGLTSTACSSGAKRKCTIGYSAPELWQGYHSGEVKPPSDIFSFAVSLYEFLTGVHPFWRKNKATTTSQILAQAYPPLSKTAPGLHPEMRKRLHKGIFEQCFSANPEIRPTAEQMEQTLERIIWEFEL